MNAVTRCVISRKEIKNTLHDFHFKIGGEFFKGFDNAEIKDGLCDVAVTVKRGETQLTLNVSIEGSIIVECDRCLEDCPIAVHYEGVLPVKFSDKVQEYDGEQIWLLPMEEEIDLSQYIYESIVLSLPYRRVHPDGECSPDMLERFTILSDDEDTEDTEE